MKHITDQALHLQIKKLVREEKNLTIKILDHLAEIERRKLFSDFKYSSLFEYCLKELEYTEDQAQRRISAMRLAKRVPEVKQRLETGELSLTNANLLGGAIKEMKLDFQEQKNLVKQACGVSKRELEKKIIKLKGEKGIESKNKTTIRHESSQTVRVSVSLSHKLMKKIEKIKALKSHQNLDLEQIIELMADALIEKEERKYQNTRAGKEEGRGRYIPKKAKELLHRQGKCEQCDSTYFLEIDHRKPYSLGGKSKLANLRLLCRNCNQRAWIKTNTQNIREKKLQHLILNVPEHV